jgi:glyceraldehyde 3-phosphate dehydrogenase
MTLNGTRIRVTAAKRIEDLPLQEMAIDLVVDCTGVFKTGAKVAPYYAAGVKKVVVSAPVKDGGALNLVFGVNHQDYDPAVHHLVTAASCTTNCLAPVVKVIHENLGIRHGVITTIHDVTNTQTIVDRPAKDMRRARSALMNLIPTTTGSATAITLIYPELKGRLNGHAVRVPLLNASITDCVFEVERETTAEEVNGLFEAAAGGELQGILGFEARPLVSSDFLNDSRSYIVDGPSTMVVDGTQVKVFSWYDNEWGYACRLADVTRMVAASLAGSA